MLQDFSTRWRTTLVCLSTGLSLIAAPSLSQAESYSTPDPFAHVPGIPAAASAESFRPDNVWPAVKAWFVFQSATTNTSGGRCFLPETLYTTNHFAVALAGSNLSLTPAVWDSRSQGWPRGAISADGAFDLASSRGRFLGRFSGPGDATGTRTLDNGQCTYTWGLVFQPQGDPPGYQTPSDQGVCIHYPGWRNETVCSGPPPVVPAPQPSPLPPVTPPDPGVAS